MTATEGQPPSGPPTDGSDQTPHQAEPFWEKLPIDWEMILGGNWLARIGVLAVVIGMGFFLKLAFENNWIGETGRVLLGISAGLAFLGAGEYWRKRYPAYAQALVGGGIALLYLSIYAAYAIFGLITVYPGVGILALVSVTSAGLAIRYESVSLAVIGILGAFVAPFLTGGVNEGIAQLRDIGPSFQFMAYVIVIDLGVLALSTVRNWRWFTMLALVGSLVSFVSWYSRYESDISLLTAEGSLTIIFLIFVAATTLFHVIWRRAPRALDLTLMALNAMAYFGISYGLLWDDFRQWMGGFTLLVALFYGGIAYLALIRTREQVRISLMALGIALVMLTIAAPVQLGGPWISVAWAAEAVVLLWLSFTLRMWQLRVYSIGVFIVFITWLFAVDTVTALQLDLTPLANQYLPAYLVGIAATFLGAYLARRYRGDSFEREAWLFPALLVVGNAILTVAVPVLVDEVWIAVAWAAEALGLVWLSFRLNLVELRKISMGVFAILVVRLLIFDTFVEFEIWDAQSGNLVSTGYTLFLNYRMLAFACGIAAFYGAAFMMYRLRGSLPDWEKKHFFVALVIAANFLTLWVLSAEVIAAVDSRIINVSGRTAEHVTSLGLSLLWAVYASLILVAGIMGRWRHVRLAGLGLLAVPILKLFLIDSFALEQGYRVAAFLSLGGILLGGGFLYQRFSIAIKGFLFEDNETAPQA
ncbi:MAG: DUF2339 domain-containing protein [Chloroflexi bacterium]|nr:DUF2339 domain-containing protein [Chloroflexota bacterium]